MKITEIEPDVRLKAYHDGKSGRETTVVVDAVGGIMFIADKWLKMWKKAIVEDFNNSLFDRCIIYMGGPQRFWNWNCDRFIFGHIEGDRETEKRPIMFAERASGKSYYGVNYNYMLTTTEQTVKKEDKKPCRKKKRNS